jgi:sporulation protein YlmC with PRC-barrel domain
VKRLLLSTALLGAMALPALAQDQFRTQMDPMEIRASEFMGMRVYASEAAVDANEFAGVQDNWDDIGEVGDVILSRDGMVQAVLVDIGGFLGIGERTVAINMDQIRFVSDSATADDLDDFFLVVNTSRQVLEGAPDYQAGMGAQQAAATDGTMAADGTQTTTVVTTTDGTAAQTEGEMAADATAQAAAGETVTTTTGATTDGTMATDGTVATTTTTDTTMAADGTTTAAAPVIIQREGFVTAVAEDLTAERLTGAPAYDVNDGRVGAVSDLVLDENGQVTHVVVDVGGFLGIGAKPVALEMSQVSILRADNGTDLRVYLPQTREELDAMERYERVQ